MMKNDSDLSFRLSMIFCFLAGSTQIILQKLYFSYEENIISMKAKNRTNNRKAE